MKYLIFAAIFVAACTTTQAQDNKLDEIANLVEIIERYKEIVAGHEETALELMSIIAAQQEYINHIEASCGQQI